MKKFFAILIIGIMMFCVSISWAATDAGKIALGPIYPGMSVNELINKCGQPTYRDDDDWAYQNFNVDIEGGVVEKISTYSDALATPNGVRVGQSAEILNSTFGRADFIDYDDGTVEYEYYSTDRMKKIEFKVAGGVITKITCDLRI